MVSASLFMDTGPQTLPERKTSWALDLDHRRSHPNLFPTHTRPHGASRGQGQGYTLKHLSPSLFIYGLPANKSTQTRSCGLGRCHPQNCFPTRYVSVGEQQEELRVPTCPHPTAVTKPVSAAAPHLYRQAHECLHKACKHDVRYEAVGFPLLRNS